MANLSVIRMTAGAAAVALAAGMSFGQCPAMAKLVAWDRAGDDYFGNALAVSRTHGTGRLAVAAWGDDNLRGTNAGAVYLFTQSDIGAWEPDVKLLAGDGQANDYFGASVSFHDPYAVVGATGVGDWGAAYVFKREGETWSQLAKLTPAGTEAGADAGRAVACAGAWSAIGAPMKDVSGNADAGAAYIYAANSGGTVTLQHTVLGTSAGQNLGAAVAYTLGNVAVGVPGGELPFLPTDHGYVRVLRRDNDGVWGTDTTLYAPQPGAGDRFGAAVASSNYSIIVGAPMDDRSAAQGGELVNSGSAYVYEFADGAWEFTGQLIAVDASANAQFGSSVVTAGGRVVVGAAGAKKAYIFRRLSSGWVQEAVLSDPEGGDNFAASVAMSYTGDSVFVGDWGDDPMGVLNAGAVYTHDLVEGPSDSCYGAPLINLGTTAGCTLRASRDGTTTCGAPALQGPDVWYRWQPRCTGQIAINTLGSGFDTVVSVHAGCPDASGSNTVACNDDAAGYPGGASALVFESTAYQVYYIRVSGYNGASGGFTLNLIDPQAPANDVCSGAIGVGNGVQTFSICHAATEIGAAIDCPSSPVALHRDVWFSYTAACSGEATVDMCGSSDDTVVAVYEGAACPTSGAGAIACIDDNFVGGTGCPDPLQPRIVFPVSQGQVYLIRVGSPGNYGSDAVMSISCTPSCRADWNSDGVVNSGDISAFLTSWLGSIQAGTLVADFNGDLAVNSGDISAFLTAWLAAVGGGC